MRVAFFVQFDEPVLSEVAFAGPHATHTFMCAALSEKASPEQELEFAVELINQVVKALTASRPVCTFAEAIGAATTACCWQVLTIR